MPPQGAAYDAFIEVAKAADDVPSYQTTDAAVAQKLNLSAPGYILTRTYNGNPPEQAAFTGDVSPLSFLIVLGLIH